MEDNQDYVMELIDGRIRLRPAKKKPKDYGDLIYDKERQ
jgi:hypothetical protein